MFAIDHVLVFCRPGAPEAARLLAAGLPIGRRRSHPGQGTANACVLFANGMFELIWIDDPAAAQSELVAKVALWQRSQWRDNGCSPFGVALRAVDASRDQHPDLPHFDYAPPYLPPGPPIRTFGAPATPGEPLLFTVPLPYAPPTELLPHSDRRITAVRVTTPGLPATSPLQRVAVPGLTFADGDAHHLEVVLDAGRDGRRLDLQPELPVTLRW